MITTANLPDLIANSKIKWNEGLETVPMAMRKLYDTANTDEYESSHSSMTGYGIAKRKTETGVFAKDDPKQGYKINLQQARIGLQREVTWEMRRFDKYRLIGKTMRGLGKSTAERLELDLANYLGYAFDQVDPTYTNIDSEVVTCKSGDDLSIFHDAHTVTGSAATYGNRITPAFDSAGVALQAALVKFSLFIGHKGQRIGSNPRIILTSDDPATVLAVKQLLNSTTLPGQSNSSVINPYKGDFVHIIAPALAKDLNGTYDATFAKQWYLIDDSNLEQAILEISENPTFTPPKDGGNSDNVSTDVWTFTSSSAYDYGVVEANYIVGSTGTT